MEQQKETEAKSGADTTADICTALQNWLCAIVLYCKSCNLRMQNKDMSLGTSSIGKLSCPNLYKLVAPDLQVGRPAGGDQSLRRNAVKGFVETLYLTQIFQR